MQGEKTPIQSAQREAARSRRRLPALPDYLFIYQYRDEHSERKVVSYPGGVTFDENTPPMTDQDGNSWRWVRNEPHDTVVWDEIAD